MEKPEKCPKCSASDEEISNVDEMCDALGISKESQTDKDWMCKSCNEFFNYDETKLTSWYKDKDFSKMTISQISDVIFSDWRDISPRAFQYADAMRDIEDIGEMYGADPASSIVAYFLNNAKDWKTETAKRVKDALNAMLGNNKKTIKLNIDDIDIELDNPTAKNELSDDLIKRIIAFTDTLSEVHKTSLDEAISNFKKDTHPEREILIWEDITDTYKAYITQNKKLTLNEKKDVYSVALGFTTDDNFSNIKNLTESQIKEIIDLFKQVGRKRMVTCATPYLQNNNCEEIPEKRSKPGFLKRISNIIDYFILHRR